VKTFIAANFGLLPLIVFWAVTGAGQPALAVALAFLLAAGTWGWRLWVRTVKSLEIAALAFFALLGIAHLAGVPWAAEHGVAASFAGLGLFSLGGAALGKPWTGEYSRAEYAEVAETAEFLIINRTITAIWGVIFLFFALAQVLALGLWPTVVGGVLGGITSVVGPKLLVRVLLRRRLGRQEAYGWPAPAIGEKRSNGRYDVAVIGAGNGGLTAAALLADAGAKVVVAEQHEVVGGFAHHWQRKIEHGGSKRLFRFDAGVHDVSGTWPGGPIASVLDRLAVGREIKWLPLDHTYHIGPLSLDVPRDWRAYAKRLGMLFPGSAAGIEAFFRDAHAIFDGMYSTGVNNGGIPGSIHSIEELLAFAKRYPLAARWMDRPFAQFLATYVTEPAAQQLVCSLTAYITDRPETLAVADMIPLYGYYFHGGAYPEGGSGRLAEVLANVVRRRGGSVRLKSPAKRIMVEGNKAAGIELATGERLEAAAVISNADYKRTFLELIDPAHLAPDFRDQVERIEPACSAFRVHLAVDFVPDIKPAQIIVPDKGSGVEVVLPSLIDPLAAPPGYSTVEMTTLIPHAQARSWFPATAGEDINAWERSDTYRARRTTLGDSLIALAETVIPDLRRHIVLRSDATPVTMARFDWSTDGAIYGVRTSERFHGSKSPLPGLVLAGSANFGGGTEAVVISGAIAADTLMPGLLRVGSAATETRPAA
jgi:phytoene dehydrogenase-like protein